MRTNTYTDTERDSKAAQPEIPMPAPAASPTEPVQEASDSQPSKKPFILAAVVVLLILGGIWGFRAFQFGQSHVSTDDAQTSTDVAQIAPQINGNITQILVNDNQQVKAGQLLATLDDSTYRAAVEQARAALAVARSAAQGAQQNVDVTAQTGDAQIAQATGGIDSAQGAVSSSRADVDRARASVANAQAGVQSASANVRTAQAGLQASIVARQRAVQGVNSAAAQVNTATAGVKAAQAAVTSAQANAVKAERDAARYTSLFQQNAVSQQSVDVAVAAATSARAQVQSAQEQVNQAQAVVAQRRADLEGAREQVNSADASIQQARSQEAAVRDAVNSARAVVQQNQAQVLAYQQTVNQNIGKKQQASAQLTQAQVAPRQVAVSRANAQTASAHIKEAEANLQTALINLQHTRITAPMAGTISSKTARVGQQVSPGQALMAVVPTGTPWVVANFKETQLTDVKPGQHVDIEVDEISGHTFRGHVDSIAAATGATFALIPPDNATGNFTKVVQRIPVKIVFDTNQSDLGRLRGGLSAVATIQTK